MALRRSLKSTPTPLRMSRMAPSISTLRGSHDSPLSLSIEITSSSQLRHSKAPLARAGDSLK